MYLMFEYEWNILFQTSIQDANFIYIAIDYVLLIFIELYAGWPISVEG